MSYTRTSANTNNWTMNNATSNKMGVVKKCPNCGATVEMSMVRCPECGYHFGGVEANSSARKLAAMLNASKNEDEDKRSNIVVNFPVPTTKADLLEFMADLLYRAKHYDESNEYKVASAFKAKFRECATKAHIYFNNDPDFQYLFEIEADSKKLKWKNVSGEHKGCLYSIIGIILIFAFMAGVGFVGDYFSDENVDNRKTEKMLTEFKEEYKDLGQQVKEQVEKGDLNQAEFFLTQVNVPIWLKENHSTDDLGTFLGLKEDKHINGAEDVASFLDNAFVIVVRYYIDKGDIKSAKRIGELFEGKIDSYYYDDTMTYKLLEKYKYDETSYNSQNSNSNEKVDVENNNQSATNEEQSDIQIQSDSEDYADYITRAGYEAAFGK